MWLEASSKYNLFRYEPRDSVLRWKVDVMADAAEEDDAESYAVSRILADELQRFESMEQGEDPWEVADSDSSGLERAYAALMDSKGKFRQDMFECVADPLVDLHPVNLDCDEAGMFYPVGFEDPDGSGDIYSFILRVCRNDDDAWISDIEGSAINDDYEVIWDSNPPLL